MLPKNFWIWNVKEKINKGDQNFGEMRCSINTSTENSELKLDYTSCFVEKVVNNEYL